MGPAAGQLWAKLLELRGTARPSAQRTKRFDASHWRKRLCDKLELLLAESLRVAHEAGALAHATSSGLMRIPK